MAKSHGPHGARLSEAVTNKDVEAKEDKVTRGGVILVQRGCRLPKLWSIGRSF